MLRRSPRAPSDIREVLVEIYTANDPMNQLLLTHLDRRAWRAKLPGTSSREGRTIAAIFAHLHNNRLVWLKNSAPHLRRPGPLDPARCTISQVRAAHRKSALCCLEMLKEALSDDPERRVTKFSRGSWAPTWRAGATMFGYMFAHEAHHRGQVIMLAHQLGYRLPVEAWAGIWWWDRLWKQCGLAKRPR
jgi:uncharacterized damage-inducible protein DinB